MTKSFVDKLKDAAFILTMVAVTLVSGVGYVLTWVKFVSSDFEAPYKSEVIYGIGVVVPFFGAVTGYLDVGK